MKKNSRKLQIISFLLTYFLLLSGCSGETLQEEKLQDEPHSEKVPQELSNEEETIPKDDKLEEKSQEETQTKILLEMNTIVQENNYYCGPAIVASMLQHFSVYKSPDELANEMLTDPITGTEYVDLARVLNHYIFQNESPIGNESGYRVQTLPLYSDDENLKNQWQTRMNRNIKEGYPSVLAVDLQKLYPELGRANHFVICMGYLMEADQIRYYYVLDPYYGVQDATNGGLKYFTPDELWNALTENVEPAYIW